MTDRQLDLPSCWTPANISQLIGSDGVFVDGDWVESKDQDPNGSIRLIQLADIGEGDFRDKSARFLTAEKARELRCTFLQKGDLLIARMPEPLGRCCIFPLDQKDSFVTAVDVCIVRTGLVLIDAKYIMYAINSGAVRGQIVGLQSGSTRKRISRGNLATVQIAIAPLNEQHRVVAKIEELFSELDKGIESLTTAREQLKAYRQAVLIHGFEGKLTADWRASNQDSETGATLRQRVLQSRRDEWQKTEKTRLEQQGNLPPNDRWKDRYPEPEPPRVCRRLQLLRRWSDDKQDSEQVFA